jgi:hypothetical protein
VAQPCEPVRLVELVPQDVQVRQREHGPGPLAVRPLGVQDAQRVLQTGTGLFQAAQAHEREREVGLRARHCDPVVQELVHVHGVQLVPAGFGEPVQAPVRDAQLVVQLAHARQVVQGGAGRDRGLVGADRLVPTLPRRMD